MKKKALFAKDTAVDIGDIIKDLMRDRTVDMGVQIADASGAIYEVIHSNETSTGRHQAGRFRMSVVKDMHGDPPKKKEVFKWTKNSWVKVEPKKEKKNKKENPLDKVDRMMMKMGYTIKI